MKTVQRIAGAALALCLLLLAASGCGKKSSKSTAPAAQQPAPLASYTFDSDLQGWTTGTTSTDWGLSVWASKDGGVIQTDGVGDADPGPNAWATISIALPAEAKTLRYSRSAHDRGDGTTFNRVRLVDESAVSHTLQDWEEMDTGADGFDWVVTDKDISAWAGQTVTLWLELNDGDGGGNNQTYWDDIEILKGT